MNLFIVTFIFNNILLRILTHTELHRTVLKYEHLNKSILSYQKYSRLYMEEEFLPSFKQGKLELILNEHNKYRDLHSVPRLKLDRNITYKAELLAEILTNVESKKMLLKKGYGENVWIKKTEDIELFMKVDHLNPVLIWYSEIENYTGPYEPAKNTRGFTQLVWKSSKKLGVGFSYSALVLYVVCYYDPPGNVLDNQNKYITASKFYDNVLPPKNSTIRWWNVPPIDVTWAPVIIIFTILIVLLFLYVVYLHYV